MIALALLLAMLPDSTARRHPPPTTIAGLETRIRGVLDTTKTPGVGLTIVRRDSVLYAGGIGNARVSPAKPATAATLFRIGSTSKAFVALTALALEREGKLVLADPLSTHLPDFYFRNRWERSDPVRIVHLLEHTSGFDDNSIKAYASSDPRPLTLAQGLALDSATRVSRWRPGTRFSYCNTGPAIVARIIEKIEGKPFEQVVQERWFDPIGMRTATYFRPDSTQHETATLYRDDGITPVPYWHVFARPAGSINASAHDMGAYVRFLLGRGAIDGRVLLPPEALTRAEHAQTWIGVQAGIPVGYGLHLYQQPDTLGFVWTGHNGGVEGGLSDLSYLVDHGVGYAFQINSGSGVAFTEIAQLVRSFLTRGLAPGRAPPVARVSAPVMRDYSGWYRPVSPRTQVAHFAERLIGLVRVRVADSSATLRSALGESTTYLAVDSTLFRRRGEVVATLAFSRDSINDRPRAMDDASGTSFVRIPTWEAVANLVLVAAWVAGLIVAVVVVSVGVVRRVVRRVRRRPAAPTPAAPLWRLAGGASAMVLLNLVAITLAGSNLQAFGTVSPISLLLVGSALLFAVLAVYGLWDGIRPRDTASRAQRVSLFAVRTVLVLHAIAASYVLRYGYVGWLPWA
jgi:CubicO group peptidase (beta-lactamase class C family)